MGSPQNFICSHRHCLLIVTLVFFLVLSSTQVRFMAECRAILELVEAVQMGRDVKVIMRAQIGSRPPRCERRCSSCAHCEAVQVPAVPKVKRSGSRSSSNIFNKAYSRGEDTSNYKPMSWKCKCGNTIFNP